MSNVRWAGEGRLGGRGHREGAGGSRAGKHWTDSVGWASCRHALSAHTGGQASGFLASGVPVLGGRMSDRRAGI